MNNLILSTLLALFLPVKGAPASISTVSDPHKYFAQRLHEEVDKANAISPEAIPYTDNYPTIDIGPWIDPASFTDDERLDVVYQVLSQVMDTGSFNIIGHNVSVELLSQLESSTETFFSQSIDLKKNYSLGNPRRGYKANQQEKYGSMIYKEDKTSQSEGDLREVYALAYPPALPENVQGPGYFQSALDEYIEQLQPVDLALAKIISAALGLVKGVDIPLTFVDEANGRATGLLRAHRYPAMPSEYNDATRFVPHSDFGTLTIIYGTEKGLEEIRDGKWVEVPINKGKGELHIAVGQVLNMWSNGLFTNNIHRVSNRAVEDRISFAYFLAQVPQSVPVDGIEPLCAQDEQAKFPPTSNAAHSRKFFAPLYERNLVILALLNAIHILLLLHCQHIVVDLIVTSFRKKVCFVI